MIYHFVAKEYFNQFRDSACHTSCSLDIEGFIHCTRERNVVVQIASQNLKNDKNEYCLLFIDEDKVRSANSLRKS